MNSTALGTKKEKFMQYDDYGKRELYNAPTTINHFYQQEVQHDMYGNCCITKCQKTATLLKDI